MTSPQNPHLENSQEAKAIDLGKVRDELAIRKLIKALNTANDILVKFNKALDGFEAVLEKRNELTGRLPSNK